MNTETARPRTASGESVWIRMLVAPMYANVPTPVAKSTGSAGTSEWIVPSTKTPPDITRPATNQSSDFRSRDAKYAVASAPPNPPAPTAATAQPSPAASV